MISPKFVLIDWIEELKTKHVPRDFLKEQNDISGTVLEEVNTKVTKLIFFFLLCALLCTHH